MRSIPYSFIAIIVAATTIYAQSRMMDEPTPAPKKKVTTAIYLRHAGDIDKPILPIIISESVVPKDEISKWEKSIDLDTAKQRSIDSEALAKLITETHTKIAKIAENRKSDLEYGTFTIRIVEDLDRTGRVLPKDEESMVRILDRHQSANLIESLMETIRNAQEPEANKEQTKTNRESLRTELESTLHRIKPREKQK